MDTLLLYKYIPHINNYECTLPRYFNNRKNIKLFFQDAANEIGWDDMEVDKIIYIKQTDKGFSIPQNKAAMIWSLDTELKTITSKHRHRLEQVYAIYDHDIYNWEQKQLTFNKTPAGVPFIVGNLHSHVVHLDEGQEIIHVQFR